LHWLLLRLLLPLSLLLLASIDRCILVT